MTFDLDICHARSHWCCLGQVWRSRSEFTVTEGKMLLKWSLEWGLSSLQCTYHMTSNMVLNLTAVVPGEAPSFDCSLYEDILVWNFMKVCTQLPPHHNRFTALFPGPPGWAGARRELLDFMVQGKINRGRHTDNPAGRHSIRTNHCSPPPSPPFFYRPDALPAARPTVSKSVHKSPSVPADRWKEWWIHNMQQLHQLLCRGC